MSIAFDLHVILLPALEEQLAASHHEEEAARLRDIIVAEDHELAVVAGIWQGAGVALATMQLGSRSMSGRRCRRSWSMTSPLL